MIAAEASWPTPPHAPDGAPDVVVVLLDDVGFAQFGCFGSDIETPTFDRLAAAGLRYTNFHVTPLCSPTRAALLTGRNPHSVGFGTIAERASAHPGYNAILPEDAAMLPAMLRPHGYTSMALGKWHLVPAYETGPAGPFDRWPLGRGFDRFYGFLGGSSDQYSPALYRDNSRVDPPTGDSYHLTEDLADTAIEWLTELHGAAPDHRFFLYFAPGAGHAPHQVPQEWISGYRGRFDDGWDQARSRVLHRQKQLGVVAADVELPASNPGVKEWQELSDTEKRTYARMMEVYAGFISHTDHHVGRVLDHLERMGRLENTLVILTSDNGASADGGPNGTLSEGLLHNDMPQRTEDVAAHVEELGGPKHYNNYPWGWAQAGNTPFKWYKSFTHEGGVRDPLVIHWPRSATEPGIRHQYHYVTDLVPTILDAVGITAPTHLRGHQQKALDGVSMTYSLAHPDSRSRRTQQHFELYGNRAMWRDGWKAVNRLQPDAPGDWPPSAITTSIDETAWELYHLDSDPNEMHNLATEHRELLADLVAAWWQAARTDAILPLDDRPRHLRWGTLPHPPGANPHRFKFFGPCGPLERGVAPRLLGGPFHLSAIIEPGAGSNIDPHGVLMAIGSRHGGYVWDIEDNRMVFEVNLMTLSHVVRSEPLINAQTAHVEMTFEPFKADPGSGGTVAFAVDGQPAGTAQLSRMLRVYPLGSGRVEVGSDSEPSVSSRYTASNPLNATLSSLEITLTDTGVTTGGHERQTPTGQGLTPQLPNTEAPSSDANAAARVRAELAAELHGQ